VQHYRCGPVDRIVLQEAPPDVSTDMIAIGDIYRCGLFIGRQKATVAQIMIAVVPMNTDRIQGPWLLAMLVVQEMLIVFYAIYCSTYLGS